MLFIQQQIHITHFACGSTAAYLISESGLKKFESKIYSHFRFCRTQFY